MCSKTSTGKKHPVFTEREVALFIPDTLISQANVTYTADGIKATQKLSLANIEEITKQGRFIRQRIRRKQKDDSKIYWRIF